MPTWRMDEANGKARGGRRGKRSREHRNNRRREEKARVEGVAWGKTSGDGGDPGTRDEGLPDSEKVLWDRKCTWDLGILVWEGRRMLESRLIEKVTGWKAEEGHGAKIVESRNRGGRNKGTYTHCYDTSSR